MLEKITVNGRDELRFLKRLRQRSQETSQEIVKVVREILDGVRLEGDGAVRRYTEKFDRTCPESFLVPGEELEEAIRSLDPELLRVLRRAKENIEEYHSHQRQNSYLLADDRNVLMGQRIRPLKRVGVYVPGGTAAYPSSVLMNVIPAKVAGVQEIVMVTPPGRDGRLNPAVLAAACLAGVDRVYRVGGAQAIGALAYGTQSIPQVDKIVGPGNIYVATAKQLVFGAVDIDMIAGPSEVLILADGPVDPAYVAADLMSQAEHDPMASAILVCTDGALVPEVERELSRQLQTLSRREIIEKSLSQYGAALVCPNLDSALELANEIAPEHLELLAENPMSYLGRIDNAGSIFLGPYTPEPLGDYMAGPNHVLPTSGTARFFSPLSVDTFLKKSSYLCFSREALDGLGDDVMTFAKAEGLTAHANSVKVRFEGR